MAEACSVFGTPVTGGNVSFYNETDGRGIYPTPVIGMVGIVEDPRHITTQWFKQEDRAIVLLGSTGNDLGATEYEAMTTGELRGGVPKLDLELERRVQETCPESDPGRSGGIRARLLGWRPHDRHRGVLFFELPTRCDWV
jgi:phosphoribosylformylglycinamidine synthase